MEIRFSDQALKSMQEALDFLFTQGVQETKAVEIIERITKRIQLLKDSPYSGQQEENLSHLKRDHRRIIEGNYKIIYYLKNETIFITDIFDSRQDPKKMKG